MSAKFHFVDLAGSERAHRTGNVGDRFKGNAKSDDQSVHVWILKASVLRPKKNVLFRFPTDPAQLHASQKEILEKIPPKHTFF